MQQQILYRQRLKAAKHVQEIGLLRRLVPDPVGGIRRLVPGHGELCHLHGLILHPALPVGLKPEPRGEDGLHRVVHRAEKALPHEKSQVDLLLGQHRLLIQQRQHGLQILQLAAVRDRQHDPLAAAVAPGEGHIDPHAGTQLVPQLLRDQIIIGAVDPVGCRGHRNLCYENRQSDHHPFMLD